MAGGEQRYTRRRVLRTGTALGVAGIAGCSSVFGGNDDEVAFTQWLPSPELLTRPGGGGEPMEHYSAAFNEVSAARDNDDVQVPFDVYPLIIPRAGMSVDDIETVIATGGRIPSVFMGEFNTETVTDELKGIGHTEESEHGEFTIYSMQDEGRGNVVGVSDDVVTFDLLERRSIDTAVGRTEAVIDAKNGDVERYREANEDFDHLMDELSTGFFRTAETHPEIDETTPGSGPSRFPDSKFNNQVAQGTAMRIDGDTIRQTWAKVFAGADSVSSEDLASWVKEYEDEPPFRRFEEFSTSKSGRVWTLSGAIDTDQVWGTPDPTQTTDRT